MAQPNQSRGTASFETCSSLVIPGRIPLSLFVPHTGAGPGVIPGRSRPWRGSHLLAVYPWAAEPAIVFCCVLSDGKQVPAIQTGSPNPLAFVPPGQPGCSFALEPKHPFKGFLSPSTCLGFNSVLAHLSWVIKHERVQPRDLPVLCSAGRGGGSLRHNSWQQGRLGSEGSGVPTGGCVPPVPPVPAAWTQRVCRPRQSCSGFILPTRCPRLPGKGEQSQLIPGGDGSTVYFTCYHATHGLHTLATYENLPP